MSILRSAFRIDAKRTIGIRHHIIAALGMIALALLLTGFAWFILPLCPTVLHSICTPFSLLRILAIGLIFAVPAMIFVLPLAVLFTKDRFDGYVPAIATGLVVSFFVALATTGFQSFAPTVLLLFAIYGVIYALLYWIVLYLQAVWTGSQS